MKKDRNTFFQEAQSSSLNYFPNQVQMMPSANMPTQASQSTQSFYAGPSPIFPQNNYNDYEARLAKLERNMSRLENRISRLESQNSFSSDDINDSTNMYMI